MTTDKTTTRTEYDAAFSHGLASVGVHRDGTTTPFVVLPEGYTVQDIDRLMDTPRRIRQSVTFTDQNSFCAYLEAFKTENTQIFASRRDSTLVAVIDYHGGEDAPSWCSHTARLVLEKSPEWVTWHGKNGYSFSQVPFAEFLEDNVGDIAEPDGATILEAATALEARKQVHFKSGVNLSDGSVQFAYSEEVNGGTAKGSLKIPTRFVLGLSPYQGGQPISVNARLRYRIKDDSLTFVYLIERPHKVLEFAFDAVLAGVAAEVKIVPMLGSLN